MFAIHGNAHASAPVPSCRESPFILVLLWHTGTKNVNTLCNQNWVCVKYRGRCRRTCAGFAFWPCRRAGAAEGPAQSQAPRQSRRACASLRKGILPESLSRGTVFSASCIPCPASRKRGSSRCALHLLGIEYHPASPGTDSESLFTLPGTAASYRFANAQGAGAVRGPPPRPHAVKWCSQPPASAAGPKKSPFPARPARSFPDISASTVSPLCSVTCTRLRAGRHGRRKQGRELHCGSEARALALCHQKRFGHRSRSAVRCAPRRRTPEARQPCPLWRETAPARRWRSR